MSNWKRTMLGVALLAVVTAVAGELPVGTYNLNVGWQEIFKAAKDTYIFAYFGNEREGMKLAASEDGLKWRELNGGRPVLVPQVGKEKLLRDPSVVQGPNGTFHAVWTTSWRSPEIGYASSKDLIHWSGQRLIPVMADFPSAKNAWAPEITYDDETGEFYIYWATTIPDRHSFVADSEREKGWNHRIYLTTTKDFQTFSPTRIWFNPDWSAIDSAVVRVPGGKPAKWMMVVKNENPNPPEKNLRVTYTDHLKDGFPVEVSGPLCGRNWVEGPSPLAVGNDLIVYCDGYGSRKYYAMRSSDGGQTWEDISKEIALPKGIRHGTAFKVSGSMFKNGETK